MRSTYLGTIGGICVLSTETRCSPWQQLEMRRSCSLAEYEMNRKQKASVLLGGLAIAAMGIYPPWCEHRPMTIALRASDPTSGYWDCGYSWIWDAPPPSSQPVSIYELAHDEPRPHDHRRQHGDAQIDFRRLAIQWSAVAVLTLTAVLILSERHPAREAAYRQPLITPPPREGA